MEAYSGINARVLDSDTMINTDKNFKGRLCKTSKDKVVPFDLNLNHAARYQNDADCVAELEAQIVILQAQVGQARLIFDSASTQ